MGAEGDKASERQGVQVIARAASILYALEGEAAGLSLAELADRLGLPRSTIQRIVGALGDEGLLMPASVRGRFTLGPGLLRLAASGRSQTDRVARPIMQALSRRLGETVDLSVLQGNHALFVDQVQGTSRLVATSSVGEGFPLHCTANGKALLGCINAARRLALIDAPLQRLTGATIVDPAAVLAEIEVFLSTDLAWDEEEHADGICAVGTAFIDPIGRDFALSIPVPASRFAAKRQEIATALLAARAEIISELPGAKMPTRDD